MSDDVSYSDVGEELLRYGWSGKTAKQVIEGHLGNEQRLVCILAHLAKKIDLLEKIMCFTSQRGLEFAAERSERLERLLDERWDEWISSKESRHGPCEKRLRRELMYRFRKVFKAGNLVVSEWGFIDGRYRAERLQQTVEWSPTVSDFLSKKMQAEYKRWKRRKPRKLTGKEPTNAADTEG